MPYAGVDWMREVFACHCKALGGTGLIYYGPTGFFGGKNNRGIQLIEDLCPGLSDLIKKQYTGEQEWHEVLSWRMKAFRDGEYKGYSRPEFAQSIELVQDSVYNNKRLYVEQFLEVTEREALLKHGSGPGLYICGEPDPTRVRIGQSAEVTKRKMEGFFYIDTIIATPDERAAKDLEAYLLKELSVHPLVLDPYRQSKSLFMFKPGVSAVLEVKRIITAHNFYGRRFFNRNKIDELKGVVKEIVFRKQRGAEGGDE
jgi:hypothetical protein